MQNKNFSGDPEEPNEVPAADEEAKSHLHTDNSLEFGKACEDLSWNHHTDQKQMGLPKEQCAEWKKGHLRYCCNQVWTTIGGRIPWSAAAFCETSQIYCLMGRHYMKGGSGCPLTDQ